MITLIATDSGGCHTKIIEVSDRRYGRKDYMNALYNSIEMVFKKLKWHRGKTEITILEVYDGRNSGEQPEAEEEILENDETRGQTPLESQGVSPKDNADQLGDKSSKEKIPRAKGHRAL